MLAVLCCAVSIMNGIEEGRIEGGFRSDFFPFCTENFLPWTDWLLGLGPAPQF
jgi:hypothetical protein